MILFSGNRPVYQGKSLPLYNEPGQKQWAYADTALAAQSFIINGSKDTVIETKAGIVLAIPAGCFLDKDGNHVKGKVEFVIKEALDAVAIIHAGLSTTSNGKLIETGGMFFIDARHNGDALGIDPKNNIYAQVPADNIKAGMQLFHGERMADGAINWVKPVPIERDLVPVDINTLNFYPPHFLDSIAKWGYDIKNKKLTDSLYYSLAALFTITSPNKDTLKEALISKLAKADSGVTIRESADCAINPSKIKAIWNNNFQNTLVATREFEERLQTIHFSLNAPHTLDLYLNNLDKPLYQIDSLAASKDTTESGRAFLKFAARHDGKVNITKKQLRQLMAYYNLKWRLYHLAAAITERQLREKQARLDQQAANRRVKHTVDSANADEKNFAQELTLNLKEACRQLGYKQANLNPAPNCAYTVQISVTGWCNIDRAVEASTNNRTTLNFTDKQTGRNAVIKYRPVSVRIANGAGYDNTFVYLVANQLNCFINVRQQNGEYAENLNELIRYNLFCIGYKGGKQYIYMQKNIAAKAYPQVQLSEAPDKEVRLKLNELTHKKQAEDLYNENVYQQAKLADQIRKKANISALKLRNALAHIAFPCWITQPAAKIAAPPVIDSALLAPARSAPTVKVSEDQ